jgi:copper chaperone
MGRCNVFERIPKEMTMLALTIPDMTCGGCVKSVTRAIQTLDAKARIEADLESHLVSVETTAETNAVIAALETAGYTPSLRPSPSQH